MLLSNKTPHRSFLTMLKTQSTSILLFFLLSSIALTIVRAAPSPSPKLPLCAPFPIGIKRLEGTNSNWNPLTYHFNPQIQDVDTFIFVKMINVPVYTSDGKGIIRGEFMELKVEVMSNKIKMQTTITKGYRLAMDQNPALVIRMNEERELNTIWPELLMVPIDAKGMSQSQCESHTRFTLFDVSKSSVTVSRAVDCPRSGC